MQARRWISWPLCGAFAAALAFTNLATLTANAASAQSGEAGGQYSGGDRDEAPSPADFSIRTLSNRADLISDGDALVEVGVPRSVPMNKVKLTLNGVDVGAAFVADGGAFSRVCALVTTGSSPCPPSTGTTDLRPTW